MLLSHNLTEICWIVSRKLNMCTKITKKERKKKLFDPE